MKTFTKSIIIHGLIGGVISISGFFFMELYNGNAHGTMSMVAGYAAMLLAFSLIFVAVKNYRDKENDCTISFGKAFKAGLLIALITSTIYVIIWLVYSAYFSPDFMENYSKAMLAQMAKEGKSAVEIQQAATEMKDFAELYKNPLFSAAITYTEILPLGIIVSLITALILKRKPKNIVWQE
jgi:amino acid transporter